MILVACQAEPAEFRFVKVDTDDQRDSDVLGPDRVPPDALDGTDGGASSSAGFSPGPECPAFPSPCAAEGREKCTLVSNDPGYRSSCVPDQGELAIGESCQRNIRGDDNCASGGFCTPLGRGFDQDNRLICRRLCSDSEHCAVGQRCLQLLADVPLGVCVDTCTTFADECMGEGLRCAAASEANGDHFGYCEIFGSTDEGEECFVTSQCGDGMSCELASRSCRYSCDQDHPCPDELRCIPLALGAEDSQKLCVP